MKRQLIANALAALAVCAFAATDPKSDSPSRLDEIAARLKPLRTWALPYAAGVSVDAFVSRTIPPKAPCTEEGQPWTRLSADAFFPFIDKYGQFVHKDWPDKVHCDADFARQREKEAKDLAAHPGPDGWDKWGGWADGPQLPATGGFTTTKWNGKWWIVDPDGHLWWSHGPVRVLPSSAMTPLATPAGDRAGWFQELPAKDDPVFGAFYETRDVLLWPYYGKRGIDKVYDFSAANLRRKYGEKWFDTWADLAHRRLRSWGCNTIANSSDKRICLMDRTPYTERFEIHSRPIAGHKGGWWEFCDPFDPSFRAEARRMTEVYREEIADPWCMGFFVDNEHNWGKPHSFALSTLKSPADQPCKAVFRDRLMAKYGTVEKLNAAWGTAYADWDAFMSETNGLKNLKGAKGDLEAFSAEIADNYFRIIREELKRANPGKLYLGCRWAQTAQDFVVRAAAKYCDIISYNIYSKNLRSFKLPDGVDVPVLIGEFHFGALDRGPFCPGLILLKDQRERAATYEDYVLSALEHPQFVGVHWHQFSDQATSGRFDGENMQVGWTDVCDTPYWETVEAVRDIGSRMYAIRANSAHAAQEGLRNPIASFSAPDPFVVWDDATQYYYHLHTEHARLEIYRAKHIADILTAEHKTLYVTNAADCVYGDIWAPEMHRAPNGKWYIYTSGRYLPEPRAEKRLIILESNTSDPFDGFVFKGMPTPDTFSIDPTVTTWTDGRQYICYSEVTGRGKQVLVIREMVNPWTFGERKAEIAHAELPWECVDKLINEGAFFVRSPDGKRLFIVYSGNGCWHDDYALGILEFTGGEGGDLCDAKNWKKHPEPILVKGNGVFGPGHASFFRSPDGTELWCAYHALAKSNPSNRGAKRLLNVQKVSFDETGFPVMGKAIGATAQRPPSGE